MIHQNRIAVSYFCQIQPAEYPLRKGALLGGEVMDVNKRMTVETSTVWQVSRLTRDEGRKAPNRFRVAQIFCLDLKHGKK